MAKPKKTTHLRQKPAAGEKSPPEKKPAPKPREEKKSIKKKNTDRHDGAKTVEKKSKAKKTIVKKEPAKKTPVKKSAASDKPAAKLRKTATGESQKTERKHSVSKKSPAKAKTGGARNAAEKGADDKRTSLRIRILGSRKAFKPVVFTLDEAREIAKQHAQASGKAGDAAPAKAVVVSAKASADKPVKAAAPTHVKAASLSDILGFNPKKTKAVIFAPPESVPEKYRRYYKLLLDLRGALTEGLALHSEQTLRRSTKEDAGDLSSYGQHMADAGTDTFDRDFALGMVANEQEALTEIDEAIKRIQNGTYGICEITQKPISKERLLAVPFTRYSAEAQKGLERNRMHVRTAAGLFGEITDDAGHGGDENGADEV